MADLELDLNQTITSAVNARVEAEMMKALSGDGAIGAFVTAALQQEVEIKTRDYRTKREPFLTHVLRKAIQEATAEACRRLIAEELPTIEAEVRKSLRRNVAKIADTLTESLAAVAAKPYGVNVSLDLRMPNE